MGHLWAYCYPDAHGQPMGSLQAAHWINGFRLYKTHGNSSLARPVHEAGRLPWAGPWAARARLIAILKQMYDFIATLGKRLIWLSKPGKSPLCHHHMTSTESFPDCSRK
ncbi:hypothetical protein PCASD_15657 [Puccinia coronata f. sp. avenae]|uniref:Uncharacterized protein n=1 Tax=Puccinia coronata f. sp. avenae TaxID=200324 RepID=A0A2N5U217_9BASI|nr:hypothetical protein PCASD_23638 [Puccinia coronata f. sp. avenae]PLW31738.1 hypothetical protein PCASD_15657 [Puccinia coronata f. sp. avenae]